MDDKKPVSFDEGIPDEEKKPLANKKDSGLSKESQAVFEMLSRQVQQGDAAKVPPVRTGVPEDTKRLLEKMEQAESAKKKALGLRESVENGLEPLDFSKFLELNEIRQKVKITPGFFEAEFRTITGSEYLYIEKELGGMDKRDSYTSSYYELLQLTLGLVAINGEPLIDHLSVKSHLRKEVDPTRFETKFERVCSLPLPFITWLTLNWAWFDDRVKLQLTGDEIKN